MKKLFILKLILLSFLVTSFISGDVPTAEVKRDHFVSQTVFVCGGKYAAKYHSYSNCSGLNNCKGGIYKYNSQSAASKAGYSACKICWK